MSRTLLNWLSFSSLLVSVLAGDFEFSNCDCDGEGFWSSERILQVQKVSDCLIATAYFSIPSSSCTSCRAPTSSLQMDPLPVRRVHRPLRALPPAHRVHLQGPLLLPDAVPHCVEISHGLGLLRHGDNPSDPHPPAPKVKVRENFLRIKPRIWIGDRGASGSRRLTIPMDDPDVVEITKNNTTMLLSQDSLLGFASGGHGLERGAAAAIRMPLLKASDIKGEHRRRRRRHPMLFWSWSSAKTRRRSGEIQSWGSSKWWWIRWPSLLHAGVLEESQRMREKLEEQNQALQQARMDAMMANRARNSFHNVTSHGMRRPVTRSWACSELVISTMMKMSSVISALIGDIMESPDSGARSLVLETRPFHLHTTIKEAAAVIRFLCDNRDLASASRSTTTSRIWSTAMRSGFSRGDRRQTEPEMGSMEATIPDGHAGIRLEICTKGVQSDGLSSDQQLPRSSGGGRLETRQRFGMCKKLVQMMQGEIWDVSNAQELADSTILLLLPLQRPEGPARRRRRRQPAVTQKLLEKLGCRVSSVSTGFQCLSLLGGGAASSPFDLVLLDVLLRDMDGFHLAARIHKLRSGSWSPIIVALTASSQEALWERCLHSGMHGLIQKPVMLQAMADELCRVLRIT
ncbi:unnamed protein product [Spirodela intermedia]|uniref:histidine kinase n=1 Tax=Spirodela intermedia TaxID=51605 RepID=A0A7I8ICD7_SPIIN|nr:unnamed protein product [Spirodela intermedia]CAA6655477.1 unnamed protein product [Spirodela intermedia]